MQEGRPVDHNPPQDPKRKPWRLEEGHLHLRLDWRVDSEDVEKARDCGPRAPDQEAVW